MTIICEHCKRNIHDTERLLEFDGDVFCTDCFSERVEIYYRIGDDEGWLSESETEEYTYEEYIQRIDDFDSDLFNQNQVRKVKLVKVPKFVADVLQVQKEKWWWSLSESLNLKVYACTSFVKEYSVDIRIKDWLSLPSNQEIFARAWLDGYEVEQEPLFIMPVPYSVLPVHYYINRLDEISFKQGNAQKFTWNEIEKYFPEITKYAVKVKEVTE
ncbi:DUF1642 domain-containing protein [Listeria monocytogenes]|uniref:DUF1642 domain-containing protein n=1 Tax=Listeria monocytogenes TaxID=1639 RepID=UPI000D5DAE10|nr:DUF1642 domain-containing protein [Listeria monocytogenes]PVZ64571.1 hypothetical protein DD020_08090 [Listeria monocytogenes]